MKSEDTLIVAGIAVAFLSVMLFIAAAVIYSYSVGPGSGGGGVTPPKYYDVVVEVPVKYKLRGSWEIEGLQSVRISPASPGARFFSLGPVCVGPCDVVLVGVLGDKEAQYDLGDFSVWGETKTGVLTFRGVQEGKYILLIRVVDDGEVKIEKTFDLVVGEN